MNSLANVLSGGSSIMNLDNLKQPKQLLVDLQKVSYANTRRQSALSQRVCRAMESFRVLHIKWPKADHHLLLWRPFCERIQKTPKLKTQSVHHHHMDLAQRILLGVTRENLGGKAGAGLRHEGSPQQEVFLTEGCPRLRYYNVQSMWLLL